MFLLAHLVSTSNAGILRGVKERDEELTAANIEACAAPTLIECLSIDKKQTAATVVPLIDEAANKSTVASTI